MGRRPRRAVWRAVGRGHGFPRAYARTRAHEELFSFFSASPRTPLSRPTPCRRSWERKWSGSGTEREAREDHAPPRTAAGRWSASDQGGASAGYLLPPLPPTEAALSFEFL